MCNSVANHVGQAFQPADSPDFPVRPQGDWKVAPTGSLECLPHASSLQRLCPTSGIQD
jgi:hypothetical protein